MPIAITPDFDGQTVVTTFEMTPGTCSDVLEHLTDAYEQVIRHQPGFLGGAIHVNDAQTRISTYSRWQKRGDFQAMLRTPEMRERNRVIAGMCARFEPVMYEVAAVY
ncbi:antibiotic biosynthesis monooxygenase family protein [Pararhodobacter aggregans]|uniref:Antibiotic biosynthesis monooxygenase n=1 Tax=Pararhodobacter aggregans TaxID=404875 RepID=A0A2T7URI9_9RHOB|nr:antibiotic biosynthesis monooxygenase [Pararhodobacter aggregans]PTX00397.1 antibiotic biosynthesis monooxygenase [Pararhodobacter aggregans]PVE47375.1 antibiotic biosynthesis monooxygenase [Pararhodobacter aggregans]